MMSQFKKHISFAMRLVKTYGAEDATCMCSNTQQWSMAVSTQNVTNSL